MSKKKIGMILDAHYPPDIRVNNECQTLIDAGFEVHLWALSYQKPFVAYEVIKHVHVHRYYCSPLIYKFSALAYTLSIYHRAMRKLIDDYITQIDTKNIHVHDIQIARSVFQLKEKFKLSITLDLHENRPEIMRFYKHVKSFSGRLLINPNSWKRFEERYVRQADKVVVVTELAKRELVGRTSIENEKVLVLPNTSGLLFTKEQLFDKDIIAKYENVFTLLYIGDTSERRGLMEVIEAVNILKNKINDIKLVIVGKSSFDNTLKDKVHQYGIGHLIDFEGWKEPQLLPSYIKACSIGLSPLHKNIHHDTTYANKIFQYMSLGKPILVSDCTAQEELVKETQCGLIFSNKNVEDFAKKVAELFNNSGEMEKFGANAKIAVEHKYNWENTGKSLSDYYLKTTQND